jgi:hypothetical protein
LVENSPRLTATCNPRHPPAVPVSLEYEEMPTVSNLILIDKLKDMIDACLRDYIRADEPVAGSSCGPRISRKSTPAS